VILAADFGGTTIKLGLLREGHVLTRARLEVEVQKTMSDQLEAVASLWETLLHREGHSLQDGLGVALALPFIADPKQPRVRGEFGKFPGASGIDFGDWSRQRLGLPLVLENDLRVALLGESACGAARGKSDVVMLAFGTGIGCAVLSAGQLFRGANNRAATLLGHATIAHEGSVGRCGNIGCTEDLASTATLADRARARPDFAESSLALAEKIDFETLFVLAAKGDACSQALLHQSLRVWAVAVQNAILAFDPEVVVLGGGVLRSHEIVLPAIQEHLHRFMPGGPLLTSILAAELGDDAALLGGEVLFRQTHPGLFP
jgi:glucokinase